MVWMPIQNRIRPHPFIIPSSCPKLRSCRGLFSSPRHALPPHHPAASAAPPLNRDALGESRSQKIRPALPRPPDTATPGRLLQTTPASDFPTQRHPQSATLGMNTVGPSPYARYSLPTTRYFSSAQPSFGTSIHLRLAHDSRPSSASCTPLAPWSRFQGNGSSFTTCFRKSSHCTLKALS